MIRNNDSKLNFTNWVSALLTKKFTSMYNHTASCCWSGIQEIFCWAYCKFCDNSYSTQLAIGTQWHHSYIKASLGLHKQSAYTYAIHIFNLWLFLRYRDLYAWRRYMAIMHEASVTKNVTILLLKKCRRVTNFTFLNNILFIGSLFGGAAPLNPHIYPGIQIESMYWLYNCGKLKQEFYAFSRFKHSNLWTRWIMHTILGMTLNCGTYLPQSIRKKNH